MLKNKFTVITDQTYLYDFSYKIRVDTVAKKLSTLWGRDYSIDIFGIKLNKNIIPIDVNNVRDFTLKYNLFGKLISYFISIVWYSLNQPKNDILIENLLSSLPVIFFNHRKIHLDLHGDVVDEIRTLKPKFPVFLLWVLRIIENRALRKSSSISVSSNNHKIFLQARLNRNYKEILVIKNNHINDINLVKPLKNEAQDIFREDSRIVVYSGSCLAWQNPDKIAIFSKFLIDNFKNINILILTKDLYFFKELFLKYDLNLDRYKIISVDHSQVNYYYKMCSAGIIFRDFTLTNLVSSPTKIHEYLENNLKIFFSGYIGDFTQDYDFKNNFININHDNLIENKDIIFHTVFR